MPEISTTTALYVIAACLVALSFLYGTRYFPPGEGYAQERKEMRISMALMAAGFLVGGATLLHDLIAGR